LPYRAVYHSIVGTRPARSSGRSMPVFSATRIRSPYWPIRSTPSAIPTW